MKKLLVSPKHQYHLILFLLDFKVIVINSLFSYREILTTSGEYDIIFYPEFKIFS